MLEFRNIFLDSLVELSGFQEAELRNFFVPFPSQPGKGQGATGSLKSQECMTQRWMESDYGGP